MPKSTIFSFSTKANFDCLNITDRVQNFINQNDQTDGAVLVFVTGSTAAITTLEYESGVIEDFQRVLEQIAPSDIDYQHNQRWGDGNGFSHVRAALLKPSLVIPFVNKQLQLGTWQQIVLLNLDNRARERKVIVKILN